jgi:hypothetical protein
MMKKHAWAHVMAVLCAGLVGCSSAQEAVLPTQREATQPVLTLVWVGRGETERLEGDKWVRAPEFDYEFSVEQRRFADHWESIKSLRRRHPDYDGSAGPREQHMYFEVRYSAADGAGVVPAAIRSSLGPGTGQTDAEFRTATLTLKPEISAMAPFDTYRITQDYAYEAGERREVVELLDHEDGQERPWVRNREVARLYGPQRFEAPPTRMP